MGKYSIVRTLYACLLGGILYGLCALIERPRPLPQELLLSLQLTGNACLLALLGMLTGFLRALPLKRAKKAIVLVIVGISAFWVYTPPSATLALLPTLFLFRKGSQSLRTLLSSSEYLSLRAYGLPLTLLLPSLLLSLCPSLHTATLQLLLGTLLVEPLFQLPGLGSTLFRHLGETPFPLSPLLWYSLLLLALTLLIDLLQRTFRRV